MTLLDHKSIYRAEEIFLKHSEGTIYAVYSKAVGKNLKEYIKEKGALSAEEAFEISRQVFDTISYLQSRDLKFVHHDIQPENIIIDTVSAVPKVTLIDFNCAQTYREEADKIQHQGMPGFVKPSSANSTIDFDSLGRVWLFMLMGRVPTFKDPEIFQKEKEQALSIMKGERLLKFKQCFLIEADQKPTNVP